MATSLNSLLGGIYTGPSGFSGVSGYSGVGQSGFSGYSGTGGSGFSGYSGTGGSGFSGYSGAGSFNGGTITNPLIVNNATATTSVGSGALQVTGGVGIGGDVYISGTIFEDFSPGGTGIFYQAPEQQRVVLQQNVSVSNAAVSTAGNPSGSLSGFTFNLTSINQTYYFQFVLAYAPPSVSVNLGVAVRFPNAAYFNSRVYIPVSTIGTAALNSSLLLNSATKVQPVSAGSGVADTSAGYVAVVEGVITTSASGSMSLLVAVNSGGGSAVNIRRGSFGRLWRIGT